MALSDFLQPVKPKMTEVVRHFDDELTTIRTGRANASLVEHIPVSYFGTLTPIRQLASIMVPEATQLLITPWDKQVLAEMERAIQAANLGLNPTNDGSSIRLVLPALTEERRHELVKQIGQMAEAARVSLRNIRKEVWEHIQKSEKQNELTEDDKFDGEEQLNKFIDEFNKQIEDHLKTKEQEILSI